MKDRFYLPECWKVRNEDMVDLISRNALLENINSYTYDTVNYEMRRAEHIVKAHICELIESQPTAFDLESVIKQLEENVIEELGITKSQFAMDKEEYSSYCSLTLFDVTKILKFAINATNGKNRG